MKHFLLSINIFLNIWSILASGLLRIPEIDALQIFALGFSGLLLLAHLFLLKFNSKTLYILAIIVSAIIVIIGSVLVSSSKWQIIVSSILIFLILIATYRLRAISKNFILHAADGAVLMEIKKLEYKNSKLLVRGKMMGTMPTTAHMHPLELWKALTMMSFNVALNFPRLMYLGWKSSKYIK